MVVKRRTVVTFGLASGLCVSKASKQSQGFGGVVVAIRRTVVTFKLVSGRRVSKVSTVTGVRGGHVRATQNCRHFWTRLVSLRLKSVNSHRDRGVVVAIPRTVVTFGLVSGRRVSKVSIVKVIGGSWSRNPELSSLLDSPRVFASQKRQQSQGSGGVVVAKRRTVVTFGLASGERRGEERGERRKER